MLNIKYECKNAVMFSFEIDPFPSKIMKRNRCFLPLFAVYKMDLMYAKWTYNTMIIRSLSLFDATFIGLFLSPEAGFWTEEEQTQISEFCGMMDARHGPGQDLYQTVRSKTNIRHCFSVGFFK